MVLILAQTKKNFTFANSKSGTMFLSFTKIENGESVMLNTDIIEKIEALESGCRITTSYEEELLVKESFQEINRKLKELQLTA